VFIMQCEGRDILDVAARRGNVAIVGVFIMQCEDGLTLAAWRRELMSRAAAAD
jgi:hypothetical protein